MKAPWSLGEFVVSMSPCDLWCVGISKHFSQFELSVSSYHFGEVQTCHCDDSHLGDEGVECLEDVWLGKQNQNVDEFNHKLNECLNKTQEETSDWVIKQLRVVVCELHCV